MGVVAEDRDDTEAIEEVELVGVIRVDTVGRSSAHSNLCCAGTLVVSV